MTKIRGWRLWFISGALVGVLTCLSVNGARAILPSTAATTPPDVNIVDRELRYRPNPANSLNNALGFRGSTFEVQKRLGVTRSVVLGDSSTYSMEQPGYVEDLAAEYNSGGRCEFINASNQGWDAIDLYARYERDVLPLHPDWVVVALPVGHFMYRRPSIGADLLRVVLAHFRAEADAHHQQIDLLNMPITRDPAGFDVLSAPSWGPTDRAAEEAYLASLRQVMIESGIEMWDAAALNWPRDLMLNQNHLNGAGHVRLAQWLDRLAFGPVCR